MIRQRKTISKRQIALRLGLPPSTLYNRLRYGTTPENRQAYEAMKARMERERIELIERQRRPVYVANKWRIK